MTWFDDSLDFARGIDSFIEGINGRIDSDRERREEAIGTLLVGLLLGLPQVGGLFAPTTPPDVVDRRATALARRVFSARGRPATQQAFPRRSGGGGSTQPGGSADIREASRRAMEYLRRAGLTTPDGEVVRTIRTRAERDRLWNVRKAVLREQAAVSEFSLRSAAGAPVGEALDTAARWRAHAGVWRLSHGAHVLAAVRGVLAAVPTSLYMVVPPAALRDTASPTGHTRRLAFTVAAPDALDADFASMNAGRGPAAASSWRTLGLRHGSRELYLPLPPSLTPSDYTAITSARRAWLPPS